jgi:type I site-specific restriction endonuclease
VQKKNIKKCVLDTLSDLVGKVEKRARKPWITQEMISTMDEKSKWKSVNTEEFRKNYRKLRNELKKATKILKSNISRAYLTKLWNFKEQGVMI